MATYASIKYNFTPPSATTSAQVGAGAMVLIKSIDSDGSDATIDFVDGASGVVLDNTYKTYIFKFTNIHPETNDKNFNFNMSIDGGSNYNVTKTTTRFTALHNEGDSTASLQYEANRDLAESTDFQILANGVGSGNDESCSGELWLFNPSSTTFVKHFIATINEYRSDDLSENAFAAGYVNTTSAVDAIQFKFESDEIQGGTINMYGIA